MKEIIKGYVCEVCVESNYYLDSVHSRHTARIQFPGMEEEQVIPISKEACDALYSELRNHRFDGVPVKVSIELDSE